MWYQYDEDLSQNDFFKEIKQNHRDILKRATEEHWIICIPRRGSLKSEDITMNVILDHVLVQNTETNYNTLSKKDVRLENNHLKLDRSNIFHTEIEVLFEETHYIEQTSKYLVWCVNWPLFQQQNLKRYTNNNVVLLTVQDCIDFLYSEAYGHNLLEEIFKLCLDFWKCHENSFETETLQSQKDYLGNLYSQCLQLCFKSDIIKDKCGKNVSYMDNFKLSIETYMQYCLGKKLMYSINTLQHISDSTINKTLRNSLNVTLTDLNIPSGFSDLMLDAKYELSRINNFVTVLDKIHCLSQTFHIFNNKTYLKNNQKLYMTSDEFLQILVYLILNCNIPNWVANVSYLKEFQFATFCSSDQTHFLVTSLEAAIAFINSTEFLSIMHTQRHFEVSIFDKLYMKFKEKHNIVELDEMLLNERVEEELCHPLCSCLKCERLYYNQNFDRQSYKVVNTYGQNFVIVAAFENHLSFLEFLLSLDFDLDFRDTNGKTALHYASEKGYQDILMLLINANADVNILDNDRNTPLHLACDRGHDSCVKALLYSSHFVEVNLQNISGETPLFLATRWGYFDIIKILLENGASVCINNNRNMSIYKLSPNYYITKLFKQFGAHKSNKILQEVSKDKKSISIDNVPNISEECCNKMYSSLQECGGVVFGVQPKNASELKKTEILLRAIISNDMPLTCFYLGYNSIEDHKNDNVINKCHPLCTCTACSKVEDCIDDIEQNRIQSKFNVNICNKEGLTPLHIAAQFGRTEILRVLLDSGALLNVRAHKTFYTPLHLAVMFQRVQTVKELLKCGNCNVDAQDFKGNTPLYYACIRNDNNFKIVESLLQNGADCQKKNFKEKTILQLCEEKNMFRICRLLLRESMGYSVPRTKEDFSSSHVTFEDIDYNFKFL